MYQRKDPSCLMDGRPVYNFGFFFFFFFSAAFNAVPELFLFLILVLLSERQTPRGSFFSFCLIANPAKKWLHIGTPSVDQSHSDARQQSADALSSIVFSWFVMRAFTTAWEVSLGRNPKTPSHSTQRRRGRKKREKCPKMKNSCITNGHAQTTTGSHKPAENLLRKKRKRVVAPVAIVTFSSLISDLVHSSSSDEMMLTNKDPFFFLLSVD
jgi:hypothetical protein